MQNFISMLFTCLCRRKTSVRQGYAGFIRAATVAVLNLLSSMARIVTRQK